jgi:hypothetical protein
VNAYFCTSCGKSIGGDEPVEVCEDCERIYGGADFAPDRFCNTCGADLIDSGGVCDSCFDSLQSEA